MTFRSCPKPCLKVNPPSTDFPWQPSGPERSGCHLKSTTETLPPIVQRKIKTDVGSRRCLAFFYTLSVKAHKSRDENPYLPKYFVSCPPTDQPRNETFPFTDFSVCSFHYISVHKGELNLAQRYSASCTFVAALVFSIALPIEFCGTCRLEICSCFSPQTQPTRR